MIYEPLPTRWEWRLIGTKQEVVARIKSFIDGIEQYHVVGDEGRVHPNLYYVHFNGRPFSAENGGIQP